MSLLNEFSIQLYSLRNETAKDFYDVLKMLSKIGYTGVEFAGYRNKEPKEMKQMLDKYNLKSVGSHVSLESLQTNLTKELEYNKVLNTEYIVCPYSEIKTKADALNLASALNEIAVKCNKEGFKFAYHNHSHEFATDDSKYLLDILFDNVDKSNVFMELDLYWATFAGVDAMQYINKHKESVKLLHIKQIKDIESKECVDLDEGIIDFGDIISKSKAYGVEHFILEQEKFEKSAKLSITKGFNHIINL